MRTAVVIAIYRKSLLLSLKERHAHGGAGEIANLVGIDAQRIQDLMTYLHAVWYSFFQIGLAMYFLWGQVGEFVPLPSVASPSDAVFPFRSVSITSSLTLVGSVSHLADQRSARRAWPGWW